MSRLYLLLLAVIAGAALLGMAIAEHPGYVLFAYKGYRFESSLWVFLGLLLVLVVAFFVLRWIVGLVAASAGLVLPWSQRNRNRRARQAALRGQRDLAEGNWQQALHQLTRAATGDQQPLVHYLGAARAANELGEYAQSDELLREARERDPKAEVAIGLTQARLLIDRSEYRQALAGLQQLNEDHPQHPYVLRLLQKLYVQLQDWSALCLLLPTLRKRKVLPADKLDELEHLAWAAALERAGKGELKDGETARSLVTGCWSQMPSSLQHDADLLYAYATRLRELGAEDEAEAVLRAALKQHYEDRLAYLYGQVRSSDPARQLHLAQSLLEKQPNDPLLLLTLGRLCLVNEQSGKAREYLEASLALSRSAETCAELARLLALLGETEHSNRLFQEGLQLDRLPALPEPATP
ncbi:HemY protein [Azotobacter beijerinckii]|uniref:HemY protein n=1 Tax=Azotobacter beijerinckii TaxID=170623 RepID=A0A1H9HS79_9GAMM|nr:heme biosynthesis HemY N-terminal domain-containing protein [Azotobacter beijerinckii]SEQ65102.1 HemY protein [Azotobacter beijerinckii]